MQFDVILRCRHTGAELTTERDICDLPTDVKRKTAACLTCQEVKYPSRPRSGAGTHGCLTAEKQNLNSISDRLLTAALALCLLAAELAQFLQVQNVPFESMSLLF